MEYAYTFHQTKKDRSIYRTWNGCHSLNSNSIEKNVDTLHMKKAEKPVTDLDKKVDKIIGKHKKK